MKGSCLCGGITISAPDITEVSICHCSKCRRWGGGPFHTLHGGSNVEFSGELQPATYQSSEWAERGFCPKCGTNLFYHLLPGNQYFLSVGLFQEVTSLHFNSQIFIEEKPDYYSFSNKTVELTGEQVFAQFNQDEN